MAAPRPEIPIITTTAPTTTDTRPHPRRLPIPIPAPLPPTLLPSATPLIPPPFLPVCIPLGTRHVPRSWQLHDGFPHPLATFPQETRDLESILSHFSLHCDVVLSHLLFPQNISKVQMGYYIFVPECSFFRVAINRKGDRPGEMQQAALALLTLEAIRFGLSQGEVMAVLYIYSLAGRLKLPKSREERKRELEEKKRLLVAIAAEYWRHPWEYSWKATIEPFFRIIKKVLDLYERWNETFVQPPEKAVVGNAGKRDVRERKKVRMGVDRVAADTVVGAINDVEMA
ncbi:hypothetical protein BZA77DRAFT_367491 [Pyronema omphalodes]|nr:hypothetical protein BZA77DRAFT_367491 [Pyronema omphalodes]